MGFRLEPLDLRRLVWEGELELGNQLFQVGGVSLSCLHGTEGRGWGDWVECLL